MSNVKKREKNVKNGKYLRVKRKFVNSCTIMAKSHNLNLKTEQLIFKSTERRGIPSLLTLSYKLTI